jgi:hypothetical protein
VEQVIRKPGEKFGDALQNEHYVPPTHPLDTSRDYSRPHTMSKEDFEEGTGRSHADACAEFDKNEFERERDAKA